MCTSNRYVQSLTKLMSNAHMTYQIVFDIVNCVSDWTGGSGVLPPENFRFKLCKIASYISRQGKPPWGRRGFKTRIRPPYPQRVVKGD